MSNWIKTKDDMPKSENKVLFMLTNGYIIFGTWNEFSREWWDDSVYEVECFQEEQVKAWCPIPEYDLKD